MKWRCDSCGTKWCVKRHDIGGRRYAYWCSRLTCEAVARLKGGHKEESIDDLLKNVYGPAIKKQLEGAADNDYIVLAHSPVTAPPAAGSAA